MERRASHRGGFFTAIIEHSLRFRGIVMALAALMVAYGVYTLSRARYDVFPEFAAKQIEIQTEAAGLSPEQTEQLVTRPLENALNGVEGLKSIRSSSVQGLSLITLVFEDRGDIYHDRQVVSERLGGVASSLPAGAGPPAMTPLTSSTGDLMTIGITSQRLSITELRALADWTIEPRLLAVTGVAKVGTYGGAPRDIRIEVRPDALVRQGLSMEDVLAAVRRATGVVGAGFIDTPNQRIVLQSEGQALNALRLADVVVRHDAIASVRIGDVANVIDGSKPAISAALIMGRPGVVMNVWSQYGANTLETTRAVDVALSELMPVLDHQGVTLHPDLFRAAAFIETATRNIRTSLLFGGVLVVVVLFLFLGHFRSAAISCTAIPLSLLAAVTILHQLGYTLNTMTLGGLAIAIGEVVDDAVIDVENILRRLREAGAGLSLRRRMQIVLDASVEVRGAVVYATLSVILVFIPILTMSGLAGKLFAPMGFAYICAILASLVVALTVTPALSLILSRGSEEMEQPRRFTAGLRQRYEQLLERVEQHRGIVIGVAVILTIAGLALLPFLPSQFLPELREAHYLAHLEMIPGTSIEESTRIGAIATARLRRLPFVRTVAQRVGRAEADDVFGPQSSELEIDLWPMSTTDVSQAGTRIGDALAGIPGVNASVNTFLTERINETISGFTAPIVVNVYATDLKVLDTSAATVAAALSSTAGISGLRIESPPGAPRVSIRLRAEALARWGIDALTALETIHTAFDGTQAGQVYEGIRVTDVTVTLDAKARRSVSDVGDLLLSTATGAFIPLRQVADISAGTGRSEILHDGAKRVQSITASARGRSGTAVIAEARRSLASLRLPPGVFVQFTGSAEEEARSRRDLLVHSVVAALGIALLLWIVLGAPRRLALVAVNLPFALVGGVVALTLARQPLSIGATVGFVTLFGITLRNSIMMLSHYQHLVEVEGETWGVHASVRGASERLIPILMTSIVTGLGLLPLALAANSAGREVEGPMAIVILGGLLTSTALNLLVLPTLALRFGRFQAELPSGEMTKT